MGLEKEREKIEEREREKKVISLSLYRESLGAGETQAHHTSKL